MDLEVIAQIFGALVIILIIAIFHSKSAFVFPSTVSHLIKTILMGILLFVLWYGISLVFYPVIGNVFPHIKGTPCFILTRANCEKRNDCSENFFFGGMGRDSVSCMSKPMSE